MDTDIILLGSENNDLVTSFKNLLVKYDMFDFSNLEIDSELYDKTKKFSLNSKYRHQNQMKWLNSLDWKENHMLTHVLMKKKVKWKKESHRQQ